MTSLIFSFDDGSEAIAHYGVKGMRWGVRKDRSKQKISRTYSKLKEIKYKKYTGLMTPEQVRKAKRGSCHDQVAYTISELKKEGLNPKGTFLIETSPSGNGGITHSYVTVPFKGKVLYIENAWQGHSGIKEFDSDAEVKSYFKKQHKKGSFGNSKKYSSLVFGKFDPDEHSPNESLQQLVDICLK